MTKRKYLAFLTILIFLGCASALIWRFSLPKNHCAIPIHFLPCFDTPCTIAEVEGREYCLIFDLGMGLPCALHKKILETFKKESYGTASWSDFKGNKYKSPIYTIPKFKIGKATFTHMRIHEESQDFASNVISSLPGNIKDKEEYDDQIDGFLGLGLFLETKLPALFLDLNHSTVFMIENINDFDENRYSIKNMVKIPLERAHSCLAIEVDTDFGKKRFLLDTGATENLINSSLLSDAFSVESSPQGKELLFTSFKFQIGGKNFGNEKFSPSSISPAFNDIDGILGMSFFRKYAVFLDFNNNLAYIGPSQAKNSRN